MFLLWWTCPFVTIWDSEDWYRTSSTRNSKMFILSSSPVSDYFSGSFSTQLQKTLVLFSPFLRQKASYHPLGFFAPTSYHRNTNHLHYIILLDIFSRILLKKPILTSMPSYCSKSAQYSARPSWVSQLEMGRYFIIYSLTSQCLWLWKTKPKPNYKHYCFGILNDSTTQKAFNSM